jgi:hypothetical protein
MDRSIGTRTIPAPGPPPQKGHAMTDAADAELQRQIDQLRAALVHHDQRLSQLEQAIVKLLATCCPLLPEQQEDC